MSWTCPGHYKVHVHGQDSPGRPVHEHCPIPLPALPAGIGIVNHKSASDVITIKTKIIAPDSAKTMVIPKTIFDTGSDSSLVSSNIVKRLELNMDKTNHWSK